MRKNLNYKTLRWRFKGLGRDPFPIQISKSASAILLFICFCSCLFFASSCTQTIKRNSDGTRYISQQAPSPVRKKIALLPFFNESPQGGEDLGVTATEELRKELSMTGEFVVDNAGIGLFGSSKEVYAGGGLKLMQLAQKARLSGLNFVLFGRIIDAKIREKMDEIGIIRETKAYTEAQIEIKIFDINAKKEIYSERLQGLADDTTFRFFVDNSEERFSYRQDMMRYAVKVAARRAIPNIMRVSARLSWVGRVARIIGKKIYLNAGRESGIQVGDVLKVLTEGREIFDPETGAILGVSQGEVKGTLEIIDYFGSDGAVAIMHSGGTVMEGDFVQLY